MVSGLVLLSLERDRISDVASELVAMAGVSEVHSVAGQYDLVAVVRVRDNEALAELMTDRMLKVKGIVRSETLIAVKVYSRYDLERLFSLDS